MSVHGYLHQRATWERCSLVMPQKFVAIENIVTSAAFGWLCGITDRNLN
jgi:hypothetical protein